MSLLLVVVVETHQYYVTVRTFVLQVLNQVGIHVHVHICCFNQIELLYSPQRKSSSSIKSLKSDNDIYRTKKLLDMKHIERGSRSEDMVVELEKQLKDKDREIEVSINKNNYSIH